MLRACRGDGGIFMGWDPVEEFSHLGPCLGGGDPVPPSLLPGCREAAYYGELPHYRLQHKLPVRGL